MGHRDYGTGTVFQLPDGTWVGRLEVGWTARGTRRRVQVQARTQTEVRRRLRDKQREVAVGQASATRITVKTWASQWLPTLQARVRPSTYATDAGAVHKWIVPTIGRRRLADLTPADVRAVAKAVKDAGRTSTTARHAVAVLQRMCRAARAEGHAVPDRVELAPLPARSVHDRAAIPLEDAKRLLRVAATDPAGSRWVAALLQGLRQGEALGLTWDRVDLENGTLDVSRQLQRLPYLDRRAGTFQIPDGYEVQHLHKAFHLTRPKTARGTRVVPMVPWMTAALARWREVAPENEWGLVWPMMDAHYDPPLVVPADDKRDREAWKALQAAAEVEHPAGRPYLLHEARHTTATLLLEADVDPHVIEAIMGHSSITVTRGYQHVSQTLARKAMESVAERLELGT